jgi:hypothetical protein
MAMLNASHTRKAGVSAATPSLVATAVMAASTVVPALAAMYSATAGVSAV